MAKVKIVKKLKKGKVSKPKRIAKASFQQSNQFTENYLKFYDDIKISSKKYDW